MSIGSKQTKGSCGVLKRGMTIAMVSELIIPAYKISTLFALRYFSTYADLDAERFGCAGTGDCAATQTQYLNMAL